MASSITEAPLLLRLVQSSIAAANQADRIIRDVMSGGELGVVDKVFLRFCALWLLSCEIFNRLLVF